MPTTTVPDFIKVRSSAEGARTFNTKVSRKCFCCCTDGRTHSQEASSVIDEGNTCSRLHNHFMFGADIFLNCFGVAATRVSPADVSAGMPFS